MVLLLNFVVEMREFSSCYFGVLNDGANLPLWMTLSSGFDGFSVEVCLCQSFACLVGCVVAPFRWGNQGVRKL